MTLVDETPKAMVIEAFARHVSSGKAKFFAQAGIDFVLGKREGVYVWDRSGQKLIDCHCNGGVFNLGHRHPRVVAALRQALDEYDIGNHHLMSEPRARLAQRLASLSAGDLDRVVFGVGGGEAVELLPPLIIQEPEVHQVIESLDHALTCDGGRDAGPIKMI